MTEGSHYPFQCATISATVWRSDFPRSNFTPSIMARTPSRQPPSSTSSWASAITSRRALIAKAKNLKWVQALTTGTETLTAPGVLPPHVLLTSTRGIHGPQMSELAFLNMIALNRDFRKMQRNQAEGKWDQWDQPILEDKTIVIVGLGILAEHLAERCKLFGMTVDRRQRRPQRQRAAFRRGASAKRAGEARRARGLPDAAGALFQETHHLINRDVLAAMKPTAFLINLARGGVLDEAALIEHLQAGKIAGAGLDIFSKQPLPPDNPLWRMPNVIITPNIGGRSDKFVEQTHDGAGAEPAGVHRRPAEGHAQCRPALRIAHSSSRS